jgi:hypothetical protein
MIQILCSALSHGEEIAIRGTPKDLRKVQRSILDLLQNGKLQDCVIKAKMVDASPYDRCLSSLLIRKTDSSIKVSVSDKSLQVEGNAEKLEVFSSWFDFDDDAWSGYHCHFDYVGNEDWVDSASSALVISVGNSVRSPIL